MSRDEAIAEVARIRDEVNDLIDRIDPDDARYKTIDLSLGFGFAVNSLVGTQNCLTAALLYLRK